VHPAGPCCTDGSGSGGRVLDAGDDGADRIGAGRQLCVLVEGDVAEADTALSQLASTPLLAARDRGMSASRAAAGLVSRASGPGLIAWSTSARFIRVRFAICAALTFSNANWSTTPTRSALVKPARRSIPAYCRSSRSIVPASSVRSSATTITGTVASPASTAASVRR